MSCTYIYTKYMHARKYKVFHPECGLASLTSKLVMTFKHPRQANTAIPANAAMPANTAIPVLLTSCETEMYIGIMAKSELLCV